VTEATRTNDKLQKNVTVERNVWRVGKQTILTLEPTGLGDVNLRLWGYVGGVGRSILHQVRPTGRTMQGAGGKTGHAYPNRQPCHGHTTRVRWHDRSHGHGSHDTIDHMTRVTWHHRSHDRHADTSNIVTVQVISQTAHVMLLVW